MTDGVHAATKSAAMDVGRDILKPEFVDGGLRGRAAGTVDPQGKEIEAVSRLLSDMNQPATDPVARNVLSEQVKDRILQWILEGELEPGARIVETRVARDLGVSQAPVREALRDLATLGVVEMQPYKGARVRQPNKPELVEQMELRGELEALGARYAAKKMTPALLAQLRGLIKQMHELAEAGDVHGHAVNNTEFHSLIMHAAGNATLERLWKMLDPYAHTYVTAAAPGTDLVWLGDRHVVIVEALEAGDPEAAADAMREHAKQAEEVVLAMDDDHFGRVSRKPQTEI